VRSAGGSLTNLGDIRSTCSEGAGVYQHTGGIAVNGSTADSTALLSGANE
jgi:hypothetical protein